MDPYRIVIPSRKRTWLMPRMRALFPTADVTVDETEMAAYASYVPAARLIPHPPLPSITAIRNWMLDTFPEPCLVMIDDDVEFVKVLGGVMRGLKRAADILRLIENQIQIACDLDVGVFGWNPSCPLVSDWFARDPIAFNRPVVSAFGIRGAARTRRFDVKAVGRADLDWTLQALRDDRIVLVDQRFHFSVGTNETLPGGALGLITEDTRVQATTYLRAKWGPMIQPRVKGQKPKLPPAIARRQG